MRILVVEDETKLRAQLAQDLEKEHYVVEQSKDGEEGLYYGLEYPIDLAIVDLGLPKLNGVELIKTWRSKGMNFPILILTARGNWQDKVEGLNAGADDYLVKPFHLEELQARVKALVRRSKGKSSSVLQFGHIEIDMNAKSVTLNHRPLELTSYEYNTLEYLCLKSDRVVSKTELTDHLYSQDFERDSNVIEVFIGRLRKKLDPDNSINPIKTIRGQGYRFDLVPSSVSHDAF